MNYRNLFSWMFGTPKRLGVTAIVAIAIWSMVDPIAVRSLIATSWNNFWTAFGPLFNQLLQLLIMGGVIWLFIRGLFKKDKK